MNVRKRMPAMAAAAVGVAIGLALAGALRPGLGAEERPGARATAKALSDAYQEVADKVSPATVHIASSRQIAGLGGDFFGRLFEGQRDMMALGSGVVVKPEGYILTNFHVVKGAEKLKVKFQDGTQLDAQVVGADPPTDLAVIKVDGTGLPTAELGDSNSLAVGHIVLAIGNPYGLDRTVTSGIISATGRANVGIADYEDFLQTDAAINPGNSGGPLVNIDGKVVGINTAIFTRTGGFQGIGFAIPSSMAQRVMDALIAEGRVTRGFLGVTIQNITPELAQALGLKAETGVVVTDVTDGGPAENAGIRKGDVILDYNNRPVKDSRQLRSMVATSQIGESVEVKFQRGQAAHTATATITEQPGEGAAPAPRFPSGGGSERLGVKAQDLTDEARQQYGIRAARGVLITGVAPGGPADKADIRPGAVILEVNHKQVRSVEEFEEAVKSIPESRNVLLLVLDRGMKFYAVIRPQPAQQPEAEKKK